MAFAHLAAMISCHAQTSVRAHRAAPTSGHSLNLSVFGEQNTGGDLFRDPSDAEPEIRWR
jgi:hypothetical protein